MIKSLIIENYQGDTIDLVLADPGDTGLEVRDIEGLGPVKATINTSKVSTLPGTIFNSAQLGDRNIILTLGLLPIPTVEEARQRTYQFFPLGSSIKITVISDKRTVSTNGYVESNEPVIFSQDPETKISLICTSSYFNDASDTPTSDTNFYAVEPEFEFPFSNEDLVAPLIELSVINTETTGDIIYPGDATVGMNIIARFTGTVSTFVFYNVDTSELIRVNTASFSGQGPGGAVTSGDELTISTVAGRKGAFLTRAGIDYDVLNALGTDIDWLTVSKGKNTFAYAVTGGDINNVQVEVVADILYEGI